MNDSTGRATTRASRCTGNRGPHGDAAETESEPLIGVRPVSVPLYGTEQTRPPNHM
jgi:hypothetical protein